MPTRTPRSALRSASLGTAPSQVEAPASLPTRLGILALSLLLAACPGPNAEARQANDRDTMTVRQRDSVTATLSIPGARGVGGAIDAVDKANARAAQHDALLGGSRN